MKKTLYSVLLGLLLLSSISQAGWQTIWNEPIGTAVVVHNQVDDTTDIYATTKDTGDIYHYMGTPNEWEKAGNPGRMFVSTGENLVGITPVGNEVWRYSGSGERWNIIGSGFVAVYGGGGKLYATDLEGRMKEHRHDTTWAIISSPLSDPFMPTYVVSANNEGIVKLFRRDNERVSEYVTQDNWRELYLSEPVDQVAAGGNYLWASDFAGGVWEFKWNEPAPSWQKIGQLDEKLRSLVADVVGRGGGLPRLYALSNDGSRLWKYSGTPEQWVEISIPEGGRLSDIHGGGGKLLAKRWARDTLVEYTSN